MYIVCMHQSDIAWGFTHCQSWRHTPSWPSAPGAVNLFLTPITILSRTTALAILSSKDGLKALERNQNPTPQQLLGNRNQNLTPVQQLLSRNLNFATLQLSSKRDKNPTPLQLLVKEMPGEAFIDQQMQKDVGMVCQKVYKLGRADMKVQVDIQSPIPAYFSRQITYSWSVKICGDRDRDRAL